MSTKKHSRKRTTSYLHLLQKEVALANFFASKGLIGFLADYLVFILVSAVLIGCSFLPWFFLKDQSYFQGGRFVAFLKFVLISCVALKSSQLIAVLFCQFFQLLWGPKHRYSKYVLYLLPSLVFISFSIIGILLNLFKQTPNFSKALTSSSSFHQILSGIGYYEAVISKIFILFFFIPCLYLVKKIFIFFAINMYEQENDEKRLNTSTFQVIEFLRAKYFGSQDKDAKTESSELLEAASEINQDIAEAIYSGVKANSPRGFESKGLKPEDFSNILNRSEIAFLYKGIDFDGSGDISKNELAQAIKILYQEQKDLEKSRSDATSIITRTETICECGIFYLAFLLASFLFGFEVYATTFSLIGGVLIGWVTMDETLKEILNTFAFLFFVHPFDVGDKIVFQGNTYVIQGIHFLHTEMTTSGNTTTFIKNAVFSKDKVLNYKRSDFQSDTVTLNVDPESISQEKLAELNQRMNDFLLANDEDFMPGCSLGKLVYESSKSVKIGVSCMHKANFSNGSLYEKRSKMFNRHLYKSFIECGFRFGN